MNAKQKRITGDFIFRINLGIKHSFIMKMTIKCSSAQFLFRTSF